MKSKFLTSFILAVVILSGCKKDDFISGVNERVIKIALNNQYVSVQQIDSAFLYTEFAGSNRKIKLDIKDNSLQTKFSSFSQSTGKLMIQLYTSAKFQGKPLQFEKEMPLNLSTREPLIINGPTGFTDLAWKPRIILDHQDVAMRYTAIVALRPSDSYFEIQHLPENWNKRMSVYRGFYKANYVTKIYGKTWDSNNYVPGNQVNRGFFTNLQPEVNHLDWDKMAIEVAFYTSPNTISELSFVYDK
jgi:hypothetical protein